MSWHQFLHIFDTPMNDSQILGLIYLGLLVIGVISAVFSLELAKKKSTWDFPLMLLAGTCFCMMGLLIGGDISNRAHGNLSKPDTVRVVYAITNHGLVRLPDLPDSTAKALQIMPND